MKALYIAWQDQETRRWHTVGRLSQEADGYQFGYTRGALESPRFDYLGRMTDKEKVYRSRSLFPLFANRLLSGTRPDYPAYLDWMGFGPDAGKLELLARSGGYRGTDHLCVYPEVEPDENGDIALFFFSHGVRYLTDDQQAALTALRVGDRLELAPENTNAGDRFALSLETDRKVHVGYCPRYLNQDLLSLRETTALTVTVEKLNPSAPLQFRLLCKVVFHSPSGFALFATDSHQPLAKQAAAA